MEVVDWVLRSVVNDGLPKVGLGDFIVVDFVSNVDFVFQDVAEGRDN